MCIEDVCIVKYTKTRVDVQKAGYMKILHIYNYKNELQYGEVGMNEIYHKFVRIQAEKKMLG